MPSQFETPQDPQFEALVAEAGWVLALAKRLARDQAAAEDIAQSTLALAIERRPSVADGLRPWLAMVVARLASRSFQGDARRRVRETQASKDRGAFTTGGEEVMLRFELQQGLARRVGELPEPYRGVLIRRYYQGLSVRKIAAVSGASPATVRSQIARGLERVRLQYNDDSFGADALGVFVLAAGSGTGFLSLWTTKIAIMQTSTKLAVTAGAAAILLTTIAVISSASDSPDGVLSDSPEVSMIQGEIESIEPDTKPALSASIDPGQRLAMESEPVVEDSEAPSSPLDDTPKVTILHARILGADLAPLSGAKLTSLHSEGRAGMAIRTTSSDYQGRVTLELSDDALRIWRGRTLDMKFAVEAEGHATEFVIQELQAHGETDLGDIRLGPGGSLVGKVVDSNGRAISDAILYASSSELGTTTETSKFTGPDLNITRPQTVSLEDGSFALSGIAANRSGGPVASAQIWAHAHGHLWTTTEPIEIVPGGRVDVGQITLEEVLPEHSIEGIVLRPDGSPAARAHVEYVSRETPQSGHLETDRYGRFLIIPKHDSTLDLFARNETDPFEVSLTRFAKRGTVIELQLMPRRVLAITISDEDGSPISDLPLRPLLAGDGSAGDGGLILGTNWQYTDESGRVDLVRPGQDFMLWAKKAGFGDVRFGPYDHESAPESIRITMTRGPEVAGRVLAYGEPVEGATVTLGKWRDDLETMTDGFANRFTTSGGPSVVSDSDGSFSMSLEPDWTKVPLVAEIDGMASGEVLLDILPGKGIRGVELHLTQGATIEGKLIAPPGMEASELFVAASRGDGSPISTPVDSEGRYRFEQLTPGDWRVEGRRLEVWTEMVFVAEHPDDRAPRWNAHVVDGQTLELEVDMLQLGEVEIRGQLRIDGDVPLEGWTVEAVPPFHERWRRTATGTQLDKDGRFVFTSLPGRAELRLVGPLPGGATVEMIREVHLNGPHFDWEDSFSTAPVEESFEGHPERARFVHGSPDEGARELTIVPVNADGILRARVPVGRSSLQVPAKSAESKKGWNEVGTVEVQ